MVSVIAIGVEQYEKWAFTVASAFHQFNRQCIHCTYVLSVDFMGFDAEGFGPCLNVASGHFFYFGIFAIKVIFTGVNYGQGP